MKTHAFSVFRIFEALRELTPSLNAEEGCRVWTERRKHVKNRQEKFAQAWRVVKGL
jgi:hypothetical protein